MRKVNWPKILLGLILALAFLLRLYHIDYPIIDYHNMKEAHTLMEARHFLEDGDFFTNRLDYQSSLDNPEGVHSDNFPLFGWIIAGLWKVTGISVTAARLVVILMSAAIVLFTYLVAREVFEKQDIALLSAFLAAVMPLFVFFGRRVFYDVPALLFTLAGTYYCLRWIKSGKWSELGLFVGGMALGALSKAVYLIYALPLAAVFPWNRFWNKKYLRQYALAGLVPLSIILFAVFDRNNYVTGIFSRMLRPEQVSEFFSAAYWRQIYLYAVVDNYSAAGFYLMLLGFFISLFYLRNKAQRFMAAGVISILPYSFVIGWMLRGHNYYQFPFIPFVAMLQAYALVYVSASLASLAGLKKMKRSVAVYGLVAAIFVLFLVKPYWVSASRQFDTQFYGLDMAGKFIGANSARGERIFGSGHQETAMYWYAGRQGIKTPDTVEEVMALEEIGYRWLFVYQWGFANMQAAPEVWQHFKSNYRLRQIGVANPGQPQLYYIILEKGGSYNESMLESYAQKHPARETWYFTTRGKTMFYTIDVPEMQ